MKHALIFLATLGLFLDVAQAETKLSWESKNPKNAEWTKITLGAVEKHFEKLDKAEDMGTFCPEYKNLDKGQKIAVWGELISAMSFYESGWNPNAQFTETGLGYDEITGKLLTSEGLLQLSYNDTKWASWCQFDWELDKNNRGSHPTTVLTPKNNLECGIGILARQINKHKKIVLSKNTYWAVIKEGHVNCKIPGITKMVSAVPFCKKK